MLWAYYEVNKIPYLLDNENVSHDVQSMWQPFVEGGPLRFWQLPLDRDLGKTIVTMYRQLGLTHLQCVSLSWRLSRRQEQFGIFLLKPPFMQAVVQSMMNQNRAESLMHILLQEDDETCT